MSHWLLHIHVLGLLDGPIAWLVKELKNLFWGPEIQNLVTGGFDPANRDSIYQLVYNATVPGASALAAAGACVRGMKLFADQKASGMQIMLDLMIRGIVAAGALAIGYQLITTIYNVSIGISVDLFTALMSAETKHIIDTSGDAVGGAIITKALFSYIGPKFFGSASLGPLMILCAVILLLFLIYLVILMIARFILTAVVIAMAPLVIALTVWEPKNRFTEWWVEALVGSALIPVVFAFSVGTTLVFAVDAFGTAEASVLLVILLIGGIWITGKMMHKLTWRHFQHGGPIGALSAGFSGAWVGAQLAFEAHAGLKAVGFRGGHGLLGLGMQQDKDGNLIGKTNALGGFMDKALEGVVRKQAAFVALDDIARHNQNKKMQAGLIEGGSDPGSAQAMAAGDVAVQNLSAANLSMVDSLPGGRQGFAQYVANDVLPKMTEIDKMQYNPNNSVGGYLNSPYSGYRGGSPVGGGGGGPVPVGGGGGPAPVGGGGGYVPVGGSGGGPAFVPAPEIFNEPAADFGSQPSPTTPNFSRAGADRAAARALRDGGVILNKPENL